MDAHRYGRRGIAGKLLLVLACGSLWLGPVPPAPGVARRRAEPPTTERGAGRPHVSLQAPAKQHGWSVAPGSEPASLLLRSPAGPLELFLDTRRATFNGRVVWLHFPPARVKRQWAVSQTDYRALVLPLLQSVAEPAATTTAVVVLDPGHGGEDDGAVVSGRPPEKELTLDIARRVRDRLRKQGLRVYLTREVDSARPLAERTAFAARRNAHVFVSLHLNQAANRAAEGLESFVLAVPGAPSTSNPEDPRPDLRSYPGNRHDAANALLGFCVHDAALAAAGAPDRGLRRARFLVLRQAPCPAVLVEGGFLSNAKDGARLQTPAHRERLARGVAEGIGRYLKAARRAAAAGVP